MLVRNDTLAYFGWAYGLHEHVRTDSTSGSLNASISRKQDTLADLFEAYIGALSIDRGIQETTAWLERVFSPAVLISLERDALNTIEEMEQWQAKRQAKRDATGKDTVGESVDVIQCE